MIVKLLVFIVPAILFLAAVLLNRAYRTLPFSELRRRARSGHDKSASAIYKAAAYGESLEILLWLVGSASISALVLMAANLGWWLATVVIMVIGFFVFAGRITQGSHGWQWQAAAFVALPTAGLLSLLQPVFGRAGNFLKDMRPSQAHSGFYEKEDLLESLRHQNKQTDSRFSDAEISLVRGALSFGDKTVGHIMTPWNKIKMVTASEPIGPMLMDELHKTAQKRFPVVKEITKSANPQVLGSLYIGDLLKRLDEKGVVRDIMHPGPAYINEAENLRQALETILKSHQHLLIVVNDFEEVSGVLGIENIVEEILGEKLIDELDNNKSADHKNHNESAVAPKQK